MEARERLSACCTAPVRSGPHVPALQRPRAVFLLFVLALPASGAELTPAEVYEKCAPSVVMVTAVETVPKGVVNRAVDLLNPFPLLDTPFDALRLALYPIQVLVRGPVKAGGSGVIIDSEGHFITNCHVIEGADVFWATLDDRRVVRAKLVGSDADEDYALLKLELGKGEAVTPAALGSSAALRPGDAVYAIGSPLRHHQTFSRGVVAGLDRRLEGPFQDLIQTDLTIGAGSSGGPLFNAAGEVVGLTSMMYAVLERTGDITFSIPIDSVRAGLGQLREHGRVVRGFIGVHVRDVTPRTAEEFRLDAKSGALVVAIEPRLKPLRLALQCPARDAGIERGDVIVKYGELAIDRARTLVRAVLTTKRGTSVPVEFWRGKELLSRAIRVEER